MQKGQLLSKALAIAIKAHENQFDKGGVPYVLHVLAVMHYLKAEEDEELQCIALLHDTIEDTDTTYEYLQSQGMTPRIIAGVASLTKQRGETMQQYKDKVMTNVDAIKVKMCDLRHNSDIRRLKGLTEKDFKRTQAYHIFYSELKEKLNECRI
jgi:guanosine-3',5'-bis(diphosphate) 3'-pyrophosphohydrolase